MCSHGKVVAWIINTNTNPERAQSCYRCDLMTHCSCFCCALDETGSPKWSTGTRSNIYFEGPILWNLFLDKNNDPPHSWSSLRLYGGDITYEVSRNIYGLFQGYFTTLNWVSRYDKIPYFSGLFPSNYLQAEHWWSGISVRHQSDDLLGKIWQSIFHCLKPLQILLITQKNIIIVTWLLGIVDMSLILALKR